MALRATFQEVIQMVRAEAKLSTNSSRGIDFLENIKQIIKRTYYTLAEDYDWPHLNLKRDSATARKVLQAGSRFYNWPADVNPLKIDRAYVKWGNVWVPLDYGITLKNYSAFDPDRNQRTDPVTNWAWSTDAQFEVWPLPASNGTANDNGEVAFEGQKKVEQLVLDSNRLDMDDILVSLMAATEILAGNERKADAEMKGQAAMARMGRLRANLRSRTRYTMGVGIVGEAGGYMPRHPTYIRGR